MQAYRITEEEKNTIKGQLINQGQYFNPVKDINGDWFIFEEEYKNCGLGVKSKYVSPEVEI